VSEGQEPQVVLALDAGVRESGWAVFRDGKVEDTGVVGMRTRQRLDPEVRITHLLAALEELAANWRPETIVLSRPSGINWPVPALDLLDDRLSRWSADRAVGLAAYTAQEVRAAIAGHPNASKDQLGYAIMLKLGLIGQGRTTHEWEAIAVGHYHLAVLGKTDGPATQ
jgi:Holliday junction resolvasome RuvABC endonuclease subunit